ncbi:hypothetical protein B0T11DRAFT_315288 [Plectosphaerella cucumerina]|uniref:Uncharacterized protein n=1 Tax=Plectosphaerella cucumerina TaxID=40658 RepID=A0A8K0TUP3_9PEZI|nr:hypothetical protein B0T11DRAFT_315288 [Plectosphaerella cucumerina]
MSSIKGYSLGEIPAQATFTSEIEIGGLPPLQDVVNQREIHRYLPIRYDAVTGWLLGGGAYLFDNHKNACDYWDWTTNEFEVEGGVKFWSQPMFKAAKRFVLQIIGAVNFAPVDVQAVGRFQGWSYDGTDIETELRRIYPQLKAKAKEQSAVAFWLLSHPQEKQIGVQLAFPKKNGRADPRTVGNESLAYAASQTDPGTLFPESIKAKKRIDNTSFITLWLSQSRIAGGVPYSHPMYPTLVRLYCLSETCLQAGGPALGHQKPIGYMSGTASSYFAGAEYVSDQGASPTFGS